MAWSDDVVVAGIMFVVIGAAGVMGAAGVAVVVVCA
jgi:hypothetical protein